MYCRPQIVVQLDCGRSPVCVLLLGCGSAGDGIKDAWIRTCGSCRFSFMSPSQKIANKKTTFCLDLRGNPWDLHSSPPFSRFMLLFSKRP